MDYAAVTGTASGFVIGVVRMYQPVPEFAGVVLACLRSGRPLPSLGPAYLVAEAGYSERLVEDKLRKKPDRKEWRGSVTSVERVVDFGLVVKACLRNDVATGNFGSHSPSSSVEVRLRNHHDSSSADSDNSYYRSTCMPRVMEPAWVHVAQLYCTEVRDLQRMGD